MLVGRIVSLVLFFLLTVFLGAQPIIQSLSGTEWRLTNPYDGSEFDGEVPGNVFTDLMRAGILPDPFPGTNEDYVQWVSQRDWSYERTVVVNHAMFDRMSIQELVLQGVDGPASVYWNGELLGHCNNSFRPYRFSVRGKLKAVNSLKVIFRSPEIMAGIREQQYGISLPGGPRVFSRKPAYHFGWDWGPKLTGMGFSGDVRLEAWDGLQIESAVPVVDSFTRDELWGHALVYVRSAVAGQFTSRLELDGRLSGSGTIGHIDTGLQVLRIPFQVREPRLWWTWDLGEPSMYRADLQLEIMADQPYVHLLTHKAGFDWGLRQVKLVTEPDATGQTFRIELNGVPLFARGANYIPEDVFLHRISREGHQRLLDDVVSANMNCLRVWGGGDYGSEAFYELCDSSGILVWQDFMFACAMYPGDRTFLDNVKNEAVFQIKRIAAHPSVGLWCGNNENAEGWARWGWKENYTPGQITRIEKAYDTLFRKLLPGLTDSLSGGLSYWESSPKWGRGDDRFDKEGDAHDWGVWHDEMPFERFEQRVPRFMSEYGFQAWPSFPVVTRFYREEDGVFSPEQHQKHPRGFSIMEKYRDREFPRPRDMLDSIYISQLVQARGMVTGAESHRLARPYCMGSLYWQLNDCWPVISWSGIDQLGYWKAMHAFMKRAFEPVMFTLKSRGDTLELWGVNDTRKWYEDTVVLRWWRDGSDSLGSRQIFARLAPGTSGMIALVPGRIEGSEQDSSRIMVTLQRQMDPAPRVYLIVKPVHYRGRHQPLHLSCTPLEKGDVRVELSSGSVQTALYLPPDLLIRQEDNFLTIMPDRPVRIKMKACPDEDLIRSFPMNAPVMSN